MRLVSREARIELCQTRLLFSTVVLFLAKRNPAFCKPVSSLASRVLVHARHL